MLAPNVPPGGKPKDCNKLEFLAVTSGKWELNHHSLVVWNMVFIIFHIYIYVVIIIPTDELVFFRGVGQPPVVDSN